jgi:hypothetical protein
VNENKFLENRILHIIYKKKIIGRSSKKRENCDFFMGGHYFKTKLNN